MTELAQYTSDPVGLFNYIQTLQRDSPDATMGIKMTSWKLCIVVLRYQAWTLYQTNPLYFLLICRILVSRLT